MLPLPEQPCEAERRGISQHRRERIEQPNPFCCLLDCVEAFHLSTPLTESAPRSSLVRRALSAQLFLRAHLADQRIRSLLLMLRLLGLGVSLRTGRVLGLSHGR
jgi:hypothetical protein